MGQDDLRSVLSSLPGNAGMGDLLVGHGTNDDAAVLRISGDQAIVQTVDFFTPIVDDPYLFGAIAAANSVSDVYAMGARPILGLAIAAFPTDKLPLETLHEILRGGAEKAAEAGFPVAGGHTIIDDVPKYGLAVTGMVAVESLVRNSTAGAGDFLYLTKPIGNGILVCAHRGLSGRKVLRRTPPPDLSEAIRWMLLLNRDAAEAMVEARVSAATDVTGYGVIGHLLEICNGSGVGAEVSVRHMPVLEGAREYLDRGYCPAGTTRNVDTFRRRVRLEATESDFKLLCDAQTSGGLLMTIEPNRAPALEAAFQRRGVFYANIGRVTDERGVVTLSA
ncbi:MAG TPA: selenide, water dikinase SelD [Thermoanaerobaculia bacterium]|nr:selenide, water dikinase SelD [Thermoanaerobaculia bacterium]